MITCNSVSETNCNFCIVCFNQEVLLKSVVLPLALYDSVELGVLSSPPSNVMNYLLVSKSYVYFDHTNIDGGNNNHSSLSMNLGKSDMFL